MLNAHLEKGFQNYIVQQLTERGWRVVQSRDYDVTYALLPQDVIGWLQESQPQAWERLQGMNKANTAKVVLEQLVKKLESQGTLEVLRRGFPVAGGATLQMSQGLPEDERNQDVLHRYQCNRFTVVPELTYNPHTGARLDLAFFINGLPVATAELKSDFTQPLEAAIRQYREDRPIRCSQTGREEPLLKFLRGALVHFAVTQNEIAMTTRLNGEKTRFLPFNQGYQEGAGNPPGTEDRYAVAYLWEEILHPESWLRIFHRFMLFKRETNEDAQGRPYISETMNFPRYHQWQAVTKLSETVRAEGAGYRYLIEHSAGSGKTNSIAWTCHELIRLRSSEGQKYFDTVIVITDRNVLDSQLQDAIQQIDHQKGVVRAIDRENSSLPKSAQLVQAFKSNTPIIVCTLQTFPFAMEVILTENTLKNRKFAVVVDEAHTSQLGSSASKLRALLSLDLEESEAMTAEELLSQMQKVRGFPKNVSYFAFTATPKHSTFSLFGRLPKPDEPAGADNIPVSFHRYTMKQAIDEGFILDVLKNYISYDMAFKLGTELLPDKRVDQKQARRSLARWLSLHPTNVTQKVEMIVEHFRRSVGHLLNHQAKAMIVTSSRPQAVAYKLAFDRYAKQKGYQNLQAMVAFSGSVAGKDVSPELEGQDFDENNMNPALHGREMRLAFDGPEWQVMIVANKFQTGFDQPKLVAMYLDKPLSNVDAVQTLSRLNRTYPGKDRTFVIDFVNDPDQIVAAFKVYYKGATIETVQNPNVIYQVKQGLDGMFLYTQEDIVAFGAEMARPDGGRGTKFEALITPMAREYNDRLKAINQAIRIAEQKADECQQAGDATGAEKAEIERSEQAKERDKLMLFKGNLVKFVRQYEYIAQIIDLGDPELEALCGLARYLSKKLQGVSPDEVDLSGLQMTHFKLSEGNKLDNPLGSSEQGGVLQPVTGAGTREPRDKMRDFLAEIIEKLNELFGEGIGEEDKIALASLVSEKLRANEVVMSQVNNNSKDMAVKGELRDATVQAVLEARKAQKEMVDRLLSGPDALAGFVSIMYDLLKERPLMPQGFDEQQSGA